MIYSQIELGSYIPMFDLSFKSHGHLVNTSYCVQLWSELEPKGIILRPCQSLYWTPTCLFPSDKAIMDIAVEHYNTKGSAMINKCRLFLQIVSICDLLVAGTDLIHPAYLEGERPNSRFPTIIWPPIPRPPSRFWQTWNKFISEHIVPILSKTSIPWSSMPERRFLPVFFKHRFSTGLYTNHDGMTRYKLKMPTQNSRQIIYLNVPYLSSIPFNTEDFYPVETHSHNKGISVLGQWIMPQYNNTSTTKRALSPVIHDLHPSLHQICGEIRIPPDNGEALISKICSANFLFGSRDAPQKDNRATHAWILSSGNASDIDYPLFNISGSGPVHGAPLHLSSSRGELQGLTALTIVAKCFLEYFAMRCNTTFICDNSSIIKKGSEQTFHSLKSQRDANIDLYLTDQDFKKDLNIKLEWINSQSDKEPWDSISNLENQGLSRDQIDNVWCDKVAENT
jgi:hypothetical protein